MWAFQLVGKKSDCARAKALAISLIFVLLMAGCGSDKSKSDNSYKSLAFLKPNPQSVSVSLPDPSPESLNSPVVITWAAMAGVFSSIDIDRRGEINTASSIVTDSHSSAINDAWGEWETIANLDHNAVSYSDSTANCGNTYQYRVCAVLPNGKRNCSAPVETTTRLCPPRDLTATYVAPGEVKLDWVDNSVGELWFYIYRKTAPDGPFEQIDAVGANINTYLDTHASCETRYLYKVQAADGQRDSGFSNEASAQVGPCPVGPSSLTATAISISQITLIWADNSLDEDGFRIERSIDPNGPFTEIGTTAANTITLTDSGLNTFTTYYYRVRSYNGGGVSGYTDVASATTPSVWLVDIDATGLGTGLSWADAFTKVQDAADAANAGEQIWVAAGTYKRPVGGNESVLTMKAGIEMYGGFTGTEGNLSERKDPAINQTTLNGENASYNVVKGASNVKFDGFVVTGGRAWMDTCYRLPIQNYDIRCNGGGIYNYSLSGVVISNCTFANNSAWKGSGIYNKATAFTIKNCTFTANNGAAYGGGIYNEWASGETSNCTFISNIDPSGAAMYNYYSSPQISNCFFGNNRASSGAGGAINNRNSSPSITNCTFINNDAPTGLGWGGVMFNATSSPIITNCSFIGNFASMHGGSMYNTSSSPQLSNCSFIYNRASYAGGAIYNTKSPIMVTNSVFSSNSSGVYGGAFCNDISQVTLTNCIFHNNYSQSGGGIFNGGMSSTITNCTFIANRSGGEGISITNYGASPNISNSIFWDNSAPSGVDIYDNFTSSSVVTYSDIKGGHIGIGNINSDPLFVGYPFVSGTWNSTPLYNPTTGNTTLFDSTKAWTPSSLKGLFLKPKINDTRQFMIVDNTTTTITIWSDVTTFVFSGNGYQIFDYHLGPSSPAKDSGTLTGAPTDDLDGNPRPSGAGFDMGAYEYQWP